MALLLQPRLLASRSLRASGLCGFATSLPRPTADVEQLVYRSPHPSRPSLPRTSLFDHLFPADSPLDDALPVFVDASNGAVLTRAGLRQSAGRLAGGLRHRIGAAQAQGDADRPTVGLFLGNGIEWPVAFLGAQKGGFKTALFASALTPSDLAHQLDVSSPRLTITSSALLPTLLVAFSLQKHSLSAAKAQARTIVVPGEGEVIEPGHASWNDVLSEEHEDVDLAWREGDEHETSVICFSSGTEGLSKGVETTHHNLTSLMEMMRPPVFPALETRDSMLGVLPFSHIYGLFKLILLPLQHGFSVVIVPKIDLRTICQAVETYKVSCAILVPPILIHFAQSKVLDRYDLSSLRWLLSGAAPLGKELVAAVEERFRSQDLTLLQGFGLTETSPVTHILQLSDSRSHPGSIGRLIPNVEARIVTEDGVDVVPAAEGAWPEGEMWVRGPNVMRGYLNNPAATAATFAPAADGGQAWLKTGDIATIDPEGYFYIIDRRKELIKYNGYQVAPAELEALLLTHPQVADVGVIGVISAEEQVEVPRAYVVPKPEAVAPGGEQEFAQIVARWVQQRVAPHKYLRGGVHLIEQIPKSPSGKILRRRLRDAAKSEGSRG